MRIGLFIDNLNIFDTESDRDDYSARWRVLKQTFFENNIALVPFNDCKQAVGFDAIIEVGLRNCRHENKYLLIVESKLIRPADWNVERHKRYKKIFCWDDDLVDNVRYFKLNYAFNIPATIPKKFHSKKLCCTIAANKKSFHPDELYTERVKAIRWFEKNHPEKFDLFGIGWEERKFRIKYFGRLLNKIKVLKTVMFEKFPSYRGEVISKSETMQNYKFSICYENIKDQNGYITEKIFDSFFAGCIPVYRGARNVEEYIPENCFIDRRKFANHNDLYKYLNEMDEESYMSYLARIEKYLAGPEADPFRSEIFAKTIVDEIIYK